MMSWLLALSNNKTNDRLLLLRTIQPAGGVKKGDGIVPLSAFLLSIIIIVP